MSLVLTEKSSLACANQGAVQLSATQSKLTVAGAKVLVTGDLTNAPISGCQIVPEPPPQGSVSAKCMMIVSADGGVSTKLKVAGKGVLLDTIHGKTSGFLHSATAIQTWSVKDAGQSKLKAP
jgi:hypothetical protein